MGAEGYSIGMCTMRQFLLFALVAPLYFASVKAQDNLPPYLYYYSNALNAFVIERADGSDSRLIGQGVMPPQRAGLIDGPGWSPDGKWLAWSAVSVGAFSGSRWGGYVVHVNGADQLELLDAFSSASMEWSPDSQWLLVTGRLEICTSNPCPYLTYWLVDMRSQRLVTSLDLRPATRGPGTTPVKWQPEAVSFYDIEELEGYQHYRITLNFDGSATKQPISPETYDALLSEDWNAGSFDNAPLDSPGGRYVAPAFSDTLTDTETNEEIALRIHSRAASGTSPMEARWHPSEAWVLLGSNWRETESFQTGYASVMSLDGQVIRELSACGFAPACVGWLPEVVDVGDLPPGTAQSVLPAPVHYDYDVAFEPGPVANEPYVLVCDETAGTWNMIQATATSEIVFALNDETPCPRSGGTRVFPFALSPDGNIYAANAGYGLEAYTALYDVAIGEPLVILPTLGWNLSFSADGSQLMMRHQNARTTWDIEALLR